MRLQSTICCLFNKATNTNEVLAQKEEEEKKNLHRTPSPNVAQQRGYRGFETPGLSGIESRRSPDEFCPTNLLFASLSRQALLLPRQEPSMLSQDISQVISCNIMSKSMEKAEGKKLYLGMPVASFLEWLQYLAERAQGDLQVLRAALLAKSSGEIRIGPLLRDHQDAETENK